MQQAKKKLCSDWRKNSAVSKQSFAPSKEKNMQREQEKIVQRKQETNSAGSEGKNSAVGKNRIMHEVKKNKTKESRQVREMIPINSL